MRWNRIVDLPFGRGKKLGRNARRFWDGVIGGWQIAGNGNLSSRYQPAARPLITTLVG